MSEVLITGGAGFIGSHLVRRCLERGDTVHVAVRERTDLFRLRGFAGPLHVHRLDLADRLAVQELIESAKPRSIFHLAAQTRRKEDQEFSDIIESVDEDLKSQVIMLAAANTQTPPRVFIRTGSLGVYGCGPAPFSESQREMPHNAYTAALTAGAYYTQVMQARLNFPAITARLALIYGPQQSDDFFVPYLIRTCLSREKGVVRHPADRRDLLYIDDCVDALLRLADASLPGASIINIASGRAPSMHEVALHILEATGADPVSISFGEANSSSGIADLRPSSDLARKLLGWQARVPIHEGIRRTVVWYREHLGEAR